MQPSYQSSEFAKGFSAQSPSVHSLHRSRSANRYSVEEEDEENH